MSSLRLLQRKVLSSSSLLAVSCRRSKLLRSLTQISSSNLSSCASACVKTLDIKLPKQDYSESAHDKSQESSLATTHARKKEDLKSILECLKQEDVVKSSLDCLPENENGFEVIEFSKKDRILLEKRAAGETIHILAMTDQHDNIELMTVDVIKKDGTCLEFHCHIRNNEIFIRSMLIKEKGDSSKLEDYNSHYNHPAFKLGDDESSYWLCTNWLRTFDLSDLGILFDKFLVERGIDVSIAEWIENYMLNKCQVEKLIWLDNVKNFIDM